MCFSANGINCWEFSAACSGGNFNCLWYDCSQPCGCKYYYDPSCTSPVSYTGYYNNGVYVYYMSNGCLVGFSGECAASPYSNAYYPASHYDNYSFGAHTNITHGNTATSHTDIATTYTNSTISHNNIAASHTDNTTIASHTDIAAAHTNSTTPHNNIAASHTDNTTIASHTDIATAHTNSTTPHSDEPVYVGP